MSSDSEGRAQTEDSLWHDPVQGAVLQAHAHLTDGGHDLTYINTAAATPADLTSSPFSLPQDTVQEDNGHINKPLNKAVVNLIQSELPALQISNGETTEGEKLELPFDPKLEAANAKLAEQMELTIQQIQVPATTVVKTKAAKLATPLPVDTYPMPKHNFLNKIPYVKISLGGPGGPGHQVVSMVDSGASASICSSDLLTVLQGHYQLDFVPTLDTRVSSAFKKQTSQCIGKVPLQVTMKNDAGQSITFIHWWLVVSEMAHPCYLGSDLLLNDNWLECQTTKGITIKYPASEKVITIPFHFMRRMPKKLPLVAASSVTINPFHTTVIQLQPKYNQDHEYVINSLVSDKAEIDYDINHDEDAETLPIHWLDTICRSTKNDTDFKIIATNVSTEPIHINTSTILAHAGQVDVEVMSCLITDDTMKYVLGKEELTETAILLANVQIDNTDSDITELYRSGLKSTSSKNDLTADSNKYAQTYDEALELPLLPGTMRPKALTDKQHKILRDIKMQADIDVQRDDEPPPLPQELVEEIKIDHLDPQKQRDILRVCSQFPGMFSRSEFDVGKIRYLKMFIQLGKDLPPSDKPRRIAEPKRSLAKAAIDQMIAAGILESSISCFVQNCHIVPKKGGTAVRVVLDSRLLNSCTILQTLGALTSEDKLSEIAGFPYRTSLDLTQSFFHISIEKSCRWLTAMYHPSDPALLVQYRRAGMGQKNSMQVMMRSMSLLFSDLPCVVHFVDDIVVCSRTWHDHIRDLKIVFARMARGIMKINLRKTHFSSKKIVFLGFEIEGDEIGDKKTIVAAKQQGLLNLKPPTTRKEAQIYVANFTYYRQYYPHLSQELKPISELTSATVPFDWNPRRQRAHERIMEITRRNVALYLPTRTGVFHLSCDASLKGFGAFLEQQNGDGPRYPVAYYSGAWNTSEANHAIYELEAETLVRSVRYWHMYLKATGNFFAYTDSRCLLFLHRSTPSNPKYYRMSLELSEYNFTLVHVKGVLNRMADWLSRMTPAPAPKKQLNINKYELDALLRDIQLDMNFLIPADKVKKYITPHAFETGVKIPLKEVKKQAIEYHQLLQSKIDEAESEAALSGAGKDQPGATAEPRPDTSTRTDARVPNINSLQTGGDAQPEHSNPEDNVKADQKDCKDSRSQPRQEPGGYDDALEDIDRLFNDKMIFWKSPYSWTSRSIIHQYNDDQSGVNGKPIRSLKDDNLHLVHDWYTQREKALQDVIDKYRNTNYIQDIIHYLSDANVSYRDKNHALQEALGKRDADLEDKAIPSTNVKEMLNNVVDNSFISDIFSTELLALTTGFDMHAYSISTLQTEADDGNNDRGIDLLPKLEDEDDEAIYKIPLFEIVTQGVNVSHAISSTQLEAINKEEADKEKTAPLYAFSLAEQQDILVTAALVDGKFTVQQFAALQREDEFCKDIIQKLANADGSVKDKFIIAHEVLLKVSKPKPPPPGLENQPGLEKQITFRLAIPLNLLEPLIYSIHTNMGRHVARDRVIETFKRTLWRPYLADYVRDVIRKCRSCQLAIPGVAPQPPLSVNQRAPQWPRSSVSTDLMVQLPTTSRGYNHVIIFCDLTTKYITAHPLRTREAREILQAFKTAWCSPFGAPSCLVSDHEASLDGTIFADFCEEYGITMSKSFSYHPAGNANSELTVKALKYSIRAMTLSTGNMANWDEYLWQMCQTMNSLVSRRLQASPESLMFRCSNINLRLNPINILQNSATVPQPFNDELARIAAASLQIALSNVPELAEDVTLGVPPTAVDTLKTIENIVRIRKKLREEHAAYRNDHKMPPEINPGDLVLQKIMAKSTVPGAPQALRTRYRGPFRVKARFERFASLEHAVTGRPLVCPTTQLKMYFKNFYDFALPKTALTDLENLVKNKNAAAARKEAAAKRAAVSAESNTPVQTIPEQLVTESGDVNLAPAAAVVPVPESIPTPPPMPSPPPLQDPVAAAAGGGTNDRPKRRRTDPKHLSDFVW